MDKEIIKIAKRYAEKVSVKYPVEMIVLYGSHVNGAAHNLSDIDIAVIVDKIRGDYLKMSADLFDLVRDVNKRIEPVLLSRANDKSGFLEKVIKQGKVIYKSSN
jgi:uncharacterized protein